MNTPAGFEMKHGRMVNVQPLEAMFNSSFHMHCCYSWYDNGIYIGSLLQHLNYYEIDTQKIDSIIRKH